MNKPTEIITSMSLIDFFANHRRLTKHPDENYESFRKRVKLAMKEEKEIGKLRYE